MRWKKLGRIFSPVSERPWMCSHAAVPIAEILSCGLCRVYFSCRDEKNRSFTGFVILDLERPAKIIDISKDPVLEPGRPGSFDDSGAMATWLANHKGVRYLYYIGWNLGVTVPFRNSIGVAICSDDNKFVKRFQGPIIDRSIYDPCFCASCCVLPDKDMWRMWYLSCTDWQIINGIPRHRYHIKYAESNDGIIWDRKGVTAIDYLSNDEYAISRPTVIRDNDLWRMWYSYRGNSYRIGYAESEDGIIWRRLDSEAVIDVSKAGWDSDMIEYPFVFDHKGQRYMLYNGNGYGRTGFGLAVLE